MQCSTYFGGDAALAELLYGERLYASVITEMELLSYPSITVQEQRRIKSFLSGFEMVGLSDAIKAGAIAVRQQTRLKLPDSIVAATALVLGLPLISADKGFKKVPGLDLLLSER